MAGGVAPLVGFTVYCYPAFTGLVLVLTFHADQVEAKVTRQTVYRVAQRVSKVLTVLSTAPELPHQSTGYQP